METVDINLIITSIGSMHTGTNRQYDEKQTNFFPKPSN